MVNQQKGVQQDTAYSAVVVNDHMCAELIYVKITETACVSDELKEEEEEEERL